MKKKKMRLKGKLRLYMNWPLIMTFLLVAMNIWVLMVDRKAAFIMFMFILIYLAIAGGLYFYNRSLILADLIQFSTQYKGIENTLLKELAVPYAIALEDGRILWKNDAFSKLTQSSRKEKYLYRMIPALTTSVFPKDDMEHVEMEVEYCDRHYQAELRRVSLHGFSDKEKLLQIPEEEEFFVAVSMQDVTELNAYIRENEEQRMIAGLIYIDNYDEVMESVEEVRQSLLVALIDRKINKYMANVDAIVRSFEKDKYMFVMPKKYLPQLQENKFALLDEVKAINIGNDLPLTLSISLGTEYKSFIEDFEAARSAMELALGRGGDQVVLKSNDKITYYGGRSQGTEKSTRVKARVKTLAFKELLETKEKVIIMAHKNPDMDAFGSAIGVYRMVNSMNKEAHIVINEVSSAISPIYGNFTANSMYGDDMIINNEQAIEMINADTMLVVVDVNNPSLTECEELISYAKTVVVFDHHRQTKDVIANATLSYVEPFASSACEMIAEMLQYMDEKIKLRPSEADAMYAGILIDTDNFLTKTGVRTFEAAAYLRRSGADVMRVRKMFRSDIDSYRQKADGVRNAEMVLGMFAVSVFEPKEGPESPIVLTAKVANEMLNIAGVRASFVIAQLGDDVKISARSIDDVNVQIIMERMGGGGHANIAAAQFTNTTKEEVKEQLVNLLEEMYKEGDI